jgi:hypothetical protein
MLLIGAALAVFTPRTTIAPVDEEPAAGESQNPRWMGVANCAAMGCHHANGPRSKPERSEYSIWAAHDKHARAFLVLYETRSQRMVEILDPDSKLPATETTRCLKCHLSGGGDPEPAHFGERFQRGDGVGCESCHGKAENWLPRHYQDEFRQLSWEAKERQGLVNLKDVVRRAETCVQCHVGKEGQEVNHDLIAAGHPRLNFEFSAFHSVYPKHWTREDYPDFEVRAWEVGQVVAAKAAVELLAARARDTSAPWPEFAEYNCFACHKDLKADSGRQKGHQPSRRPGTFPWGSWYVTELLPLTQRAGSEGQRVQQGVERLRSFMQEPGPSRTRVTAQAKEVAELLHQWAGVLAKQEANPRQALDLMRALAEDAANRADAMSWDEAAQSFLGLAALCRGLDGVPAVSPAAGVKSELRKMRGRLKGAFEYGFASPRKFNPLAEPRLRDEFQTIRNHLGKE